MFETTDFLYGMLSEKRIYPRSMFSINLINFENQQLGCLTTNDVVAGTSEDRRLI